MNTVRILPATSNPEVGKVFKMRSAIIREIRAFLEARGFMEVETPMLQNLAGGASANPFKTFFEALNSPMTTGIFFSSSSCLRPLKKLLIAPV